MNTLNFLRSFTLLAALLLTAAYGFAQQEQKTKTEDTSGKVIIITKSSDGTEKKIEKTIPAGDGVQELNLDETNGKIIIEQQGEGTGKTIQVIVAPEDVDLKLNQNVDVNVEDVNGEKRVRVRVKPHGGSEEKVFEWEGEGGIPAELRQELESEGIFLQDEGETKGIFIHKADDKDGNFTWSSQDDEPRPFLGVVGSIESEVVVIKDENGVQQTTEPASAATGIEIGEVMEGSAAAEAGLKQGDILRAIDGRQLNDFNDLVEFMQDAQIGQQVNISYERDGQLLQTQATLQERKGDVGNIIIREIEEKDGGEHTFFYSTGDDEDVKVHTRRHVVVVTRGDKTKESSESPVLPAGTLPENDLPRSLQLTDYQVFPNPTNGKLRLQFTAASLPTTVRITDMSGKNLYRETLNQFNGRYDENIDLTDLPAGLLLLTIEQADKVYTEQIVLK